MSQRIILILEDDAARVARFEAALGDAWQVIQRPNVPEMIGATKKSLASADILSLDHDLYDPDHPDNDPGDGLEFVRRLVDQEPVRPVIVHSSNAIRAKVMIGDLNLAKWTAELVLPISADWAENDWRTMVDRLVQPRAVGERTATLSISMVEVSSLRARSLGESEGKRNLSRGSHGQPKLVV